MKFDKNELERLLREEFHKCHAPVSGYKVACAIVTDKGVYFDHNVEHEDTIIFEHAECRAIDQIKQTESGFHINNIVLFGGGNIKKHKYYIPCFNCTEALRKYASDETEIRLLPIEGITQELSMPFKELVGSYTELPYSKIEGQTLDDIKSELRTKTVLEGGDLDCVADIAYLGREAGAQFYLTGSSSGRGAVSDLVHKKIGRHYRDIDFIAVVEKQFPNTEQRFEGILSKNYGTVIKEKRPLLAHQSKPGVVFGKTFYYCGSNKKRIIDIACCSSFEESFSYPAYQKRNWFHQLS